MPIRRDRYPDNWKQISWQVRFEAGWCCEVCGARHRRPHPETGSEVVLTVAHLDHNPANCRRENLVAMCQRCHLAYDRQEHLVNAKITRAHKCGQLVFPGVLVVEPPSQGLVHWFTRVQKGEPMSAVDNPKQLYRRAQCKECGRERLFAHVYANIWRCPAGHIVHMPLSYVRWPRVPLRYGDEVLAPAPKPEPATTSPDDPIGTLYRDWMSVVNGDESAYPNREMLTKYARWGRALLAGGKHENEGADFRRFCRVRVEGQARGLDLYTAGAAYGNGADYPPRPGWEFLAEPGTPVLRRGPAEQLALPFCVGE